LTGVAVVMIVVGVAIFVLGIALIWYLLARGPSAATTSREDFDAEYDRLVRTGELPAGDDREAAWRDFHARQVTEEEERLSWEEET
jgi:hypothetical protein